jgi:2-methylcitrate dehydratase PrpD
MGEIRADGATLTERLATSVAGPADRIPSDVRSWTCLLALDAIGIAVANRDAPFAVAMRAVAEGTSAGGHATVIGGTTPLVAEAAAEVNSAAMHGSDLDATHIESIIHPTAIGIPVGLAVGEESGASGREVVAAMALGMEALVRLGLGAGGAYHLRGFQATALLGPVVAALMTARLREHDDVAASEAAGLATAIAAGLRSFSDDGTWGKRLITGWACRAGIHADALVASGFRGTRDGLEKRWGLYHAFLPDRPPALERVTAGLGEVWHVLDTEPKRYPCSHGLHPFIEAALAVREGLDPATIERVECRVNDEARRWWFEPAAARYRPDAYGARFSIPYVVARAILHGGVDDDAFDAQSVADPAVLDMTARVVPLRDAALEGRAPVGLPGGLRVVRRDGSSLDVPVAPHPAAPEAFIVERFRRAVGSVIGREGAARLESAVLGLPDAPDLAELSAALA